MEQYVIVGNGVAAAGCIEGIRTVDKHTPITVISGEKYPVYCRPLISYYLQGKTNLERMYYRSESFYNDNGCQVIYGETANQIDQKEHTVTLASGQKIPFSKLLVASGSSPFVPRFDGIETVKNRFSFMTLDDTFSLEQAICSTSRVLIIGAGLIGLKCAEGLQGRVGKITVCDLADNILSSILDADTAPAVQDHLEQNGIEFLMGDSVKSFTQDIAEMQSGRQIPFDILVMAVGVRPNTALVADIGGEINRGIMVNTKMQTSIPDIYAAGDCSEGYDLSVGKNRVLALLPNAYMGGFTAGVNMAGGNKEFDNAIPMNSIGLMGLHIMTAGNYVTEKDGGQVLCDQSKNGTRKFFVQDDALKGYILVGDVLGGGIYTALIREMTPMHTLDFESLQKDPNYFAFSAETRRKKFGGVV
ncbi:MAG: FAD-dependent oxidoreductase [Oscillospiraceae bacterium]|nr:FAD-dependent oxidoreductase [Oscillospiraceae bacterium]